MMIGGILSHIPSQLSHLNLTLEVPFETRIKYFPLRRFEPVHHRGYRTEIISHAVVDEFQIDEIGYCETPLVVVCCEFRIEPHNPLFPEMGEFLIECHVDRGETVRVELEGDLMLI